MDRATTSVYAKSAEIPLIKITFNDPEKLCVNPTIDSDSRIYMNYNFVARSSKNPEQKWSARMITRELKSGESQTVPTLSTPDFIDGYTYDDFGFSTLGNHCGVLPSRVKDSGNCGENLASQFKSNNTQIIVTPEKVSSGAFGDYYRLNCQVVS